MESKLDQLRQMTSVVADTGDVEAIKRLKPIDATTNPSLLLKAAEQEIYQPLISEALEFASKTHAANTAAWLAQSCNYLSVAIGSQIAQQIPGRISTEVDARLSFDTQKTIERARLLIALYQNKGIDRDKILIKIAATWEGIEAARVLEQENIQCNLTLVFNQTQAVACAQANIHLISPFVGRILDWHKQENPEKIYSSKDDPGVVSVTQIYHYFKYFEHNTIVMGASFRNTGEIEQLAGCDKLTIAPTLMDQLSKDNGPLKRILKENHRPSDLQPLRINKNSFHWDLNQDPMAHNKLADGIRRFAQDQVSLENKLVKIAEQ